MCIDRSIGPSIDRIKSITITACLHRFPFFIRRRKWNYSVDLYSGFTINFSVLCFRLTKSKTNSVTSKEIFDNFNRWTIAIGIGPSNQWLPWASRSNAQVLCFCPLLLWIDCRLIERWTWWFKLFVNRIIWHGSMTEIDYIICIVCIESGKSQDNSIVNTKRDTILPWQ